MSNADDDLPFGLYERLVTAGLKARLLRFDSDSARIVKKELDPAEAHATLARHIANVVARALNALPQEDRAAAQSELTNQIISLLAGNPAERRAATMTWLKSRLKNCGRFSRSARCRMTNRDVVAPLVALSASDLLVNARGEPGLAHALAHEIPSADSIDLLCAFVRWHGLRLLEDQLEAHCRAGRPTARDHHRVHRIHRTESARLAGGARRAGQGVVRHAVHAPAREGVAVPPRHRLLHRLHRLVKSVEVGARGRRGMERAPIAGGLAGHPREVRRHVRHATGKAPNTSPTNRPAMPLDSIALWRREQGDSLEAPLLFLDVEPWPHQREMLEKLAVERERHHRFKNLVVAATGTGKTIVAALDYKRLRDQHGDLRLLFVAHRQEILKQSLGAFRQVLRSGDFGELYVDGHRPDEWRHVFASIQSLAQVDLEQLDPTAFDVVIVDEFHHAAAPTYRRLLEHLFEGDEADSLRQPPRILLGLTATPERTDAEDILHYFDNHIAVELRLWDALERGLLCPFQYFGLHDNTDLSSVRWSRKGYDTAELERLYTGDDARVRLVLEQVRQKHRDAGTMRALGFCVSIAHAEFMARRFTEAGLPSARRVCGHRQRHAKGRSGVAACGAGAGALRGGPVQRGRRSPGSRHAALSAADGKRARVSPAARARAAAPREKRLRDGAGLHRPVAPAVPLRPALSRRHGDHANRSREAGPTGLSVPACRLLDAAGSGRDADRPRQSEERHPLASSCDGEGIDGARRRPFGCPDVASRLPNSFRRLGWSWRTSTVPAVGRACNVTRGLKVPAPGPHEALIGDRLAGILHVDDPLRLEAYERLAASASVINGLTDAERRLVTGFHFAVIPSKIAPKTLAESVALLHAHPAIVVALAETLFLELQGTGVGVSVLCPGLVRTGIFDSERNRPDRFGGSDHEADEIQRFHQAMLDMIRGIDPSVVADMVVDAIRAETLWTFQRAAPTFRIEVVPTRTGWPALLAILDQSDDRPIFFGSGAVDLIVVVKTNQRHIGRHLEHFEAVDIHELFGFGKRCELEEQVDGPVQNAAEMGSSWKEASESCAPSRGMPQRSGRFIPMAFR